MRVDPQRTFRSFIVGSSNRLAVSMVRRAIGRSAERPNPVLLVGGTGVGKSHLLSAAVVEIRRTNPNADVVVFKAEDFMNRYVHAIRSGEMYSFRDRLRAGTALLIDEVEDLLTRPATFEELASAVAIYVETGRPVVMAMARRHSDYKYIEAYIHWLATGVVAELGAPSVGQRICAMRRAPGGKRVSARKLTALARESPTIPLARAALANSLVRARLGL